MLDLFSIPLVSPPHASCTMQTLMLVFIGCSSQALQCTVVCWWVDGGRATGELYFSHNFWLFFFLLQMKKELRVSADILIKCCWLCAILSLHCRKVVVFLSEPTNNRSAFLVFAQHVMQSILSCHY